jgi:uncharacterized protein YbjT (DUF2867 family)
MRWDRRGAMAAMATRKVATVFGGSGFIGRYVVKRLARAGYVVRVAVRDTEAALFLKPMGAVGQIVPLHADVTNDATVHRAVEGADLVVNLVGILAEGRPGDFQRIHADAAGAIARLSANAGVFRLAHVSAIAADTASPSQYARSKYAGERAVRQAFPRATILRPGVVFGPEDNFFNMFAGMARLAPFMPVISGNSKLQPVFVGDVADAIMAALRSEDCEGELYVLGGPRIWTFREILAYILKETGRERRLVDIPMGIARIQAFFTERMPGKPLTRDQLLLISQDSVVPFGAQGLAELGIAPTPVELIAPMYLKRYQPGGGRRPVLAPDAPLPEALLPDAPRTETRQ